MGTLSGQQCCRSRKESAFRDIEEHSQPGTIENARVAALIPVKRVSQDTGDRRLLIAPTQKNGSRSRHTQTKEGNR